MIQHRMHFITLMMAFQFRQAYELYPEIYKEYQASGLLLWNFLREFAKETCYQKDQYDCINMQIRAELTGADAHRYMINYINLGEFETETMRKVAISKQRQSAEKYAEARKLLLTLLE